MTRQVLKQERCKITVAVLAYPIKLILECLFRLNEIPKDWLPTDVFQKQSKAESGYYLPN
jgi:hypothetical protein